MAPILSSFGSAASRNYGLNLLQGGQLTVIQIFNATTTWSPPTGVSEINYLVVAGGGGGGTNRGGGGGAGGFRTGTALSVSSSTVYTLTIGAGGGANGPTGS